MKKLVKFVPTFLFLLGTGYALQKGYGWIGLATIVCAVLSFFIGADAFDKTFL